MGMPAIESPGFAGFVATLWRGWLWATGGHEIDRVAPSVYVGSIAAAADAEVLAEHGITHVVAATQFGDAARFHPDRVVYHVVTIDDVVWADISPAFVDTAAFIQNAVRNGGRVLVHCNAGRSRSVSLVVAWMLLHVPGVTTVEQALALIRAHRPEALPNPSFVRQLKALEAGSR